MLQDIRFHCELGDCELSNCGMAQPLTLELSVYCNQGPVVWLG